MNDKQIAYVEGLMSESKITREQISKEHPEWEHYEHINNQNEITALIRFLSNMLVDDFYSDQYVLNVIRSVLADRYIHRKKIAQLEDLRDDKREERIRTLRHRLACCEEALDLMAEEIALADPEIADAIFRSFAERGSRGARLAARGIEWHLGRVVQA